MRKYYAIFNSCSLSYNYESGYYYTVKTKHFYDGKLLSDADLFESKEEAIKRLDELIEDRVYQIIEVYIKED